MNNKSRIRSILKANCLDSSITGFQSFELSELDLSADIDIQLPLNVRLGHLAEGVVSALIKASNNYKVLYENIQIIEDKKTIGEIDFIIEDLVENRIIHMELAYKFYLFDPDIAADSLHNWIGPNRNDSLKEKLEKLKSKQFPLLQHSCSKSTLANINVSDVSQALCFLISLFVPYGYKGTLSPSYQKGIKGYYLNFETFTNLNNPRKSYHIPSKKLWGMDPSENEEWADYNGIIEQITTSLKGKQALLCWQKCGDSYLSFFIVWW